MRVGLERMGALIPLVLGAGVAFQQFAVVGRWTFAVSFGLVLPIVAALDWRAQHRRSDETGRVADRWLGMFSFALLAAGL